MIFFQFIQRPRHPFVRLLMAVLGLVILLGVLALGLFAIAAVVIVGAAWLGLRALFGAKPATPHTPGARTSDDGAIDGEFTVVDRNANPPMRIEHAPLPEAHRDRS